jgi:lipid II isoglutaminyl synthase (glutamine-hydrolysing)
MTKILHIGYFYPDLLNLYGDNGNVEILKYRAQKYGFEVKVSHINVATDITTPDYDSLNLVFMGGGPDSGQKSMYDDLVTFKKDFLAAYISAEKVGLFICGAYQLLGHYYKAEDGSILPGLGIFDLYTEQPGKNIPRCIGNTYARLADDILLDPLRPVSAFGDYIVGFENHGGRTYLGKHITPFAKVVKGYGNNAEDSTEGALYKNSIGTYFHGPFLARNPHVADYLIYKALLLDPMEIKLLPKIDDTLTLAAHTASKNLKQ